MIGHRRLAWPWIAWLFGMVLAGSIAASQTTVALLDVTDGELTAEQQKSWQNWRDLLEAQLSHRDEWRVVERARLNKILQELELRFYGRSAEERAVLQGGMLGAELLIQPVVTKKGDAPELMTAVVSTRLAERVGELVLKWPLPPAETFWRESLAKELQSARVILEKTRNQPTVAVLFFENETKEGRFQYLGEKLEKSLADTLAKTGKFHVLRRQEVVTARPETVLAATGWPQPSPLWQAQRADILIYGSFTTQVDPTIPADEQTFEVQVCGFDRAKKQVRTVKGKLTPGNLAVVMAQMVPPVSNPSLPAPGTTSVALESPRNESEKFLARALKLLAISKNENKEIQPEFVADAEAQAMRNLLLSTFLAPDWEEPLRRVIELANSRIPDWEARRIDNVLQHAPRFSLAMEYFSRFGGFETENGKRMRKMLHTDVCTFLMVNGPGGTEEERASFRKKFKFLRDLIISEYLHEVPQCERNTLFYYYYMDFLRGLYDSQAHFALLEQTRSYWMKNCEVIRCLDTYCRYAHTPEQKQCARRAVQGWMETLAVGGKRKFSQEEAFLIEDMLKLLDLEAFSKVAVERLERGERPFKADDGVKAAQTKPAVIWSDPKTYRLATPEEVDAFSRSVQKARSEAKAGDKAVLKIMQDYLRVHGKAKAFQVFSESYEYSWCASPERIECFELFAQTVMSSKTGTPHVDFQGRDGKEQMLLALYLWLQDAALCYRESFVETELLNLQRCYDAVGESAWGRAQVARLRAGKAPWRIYTRDAHDEIRGGELFCYPYFDLPMPRIQVAASLFPVPESSFSSAAPNCQVRVSSIRLLAYAAPRLYLGCKVDWYTAHGSDGRPTQYRLMEFDEDTGQWRDLTAWCEAKHPELAWAFVDGERCIAGADADGIWVFDTKGQKSRHLTIEQGLPSNHIYCATRVKDAIWLAGGQNKAALARLDLATLKVITPTLKVDTAGHSFIWSREWNGQLWLTSGSRANGGGYDAVWNFDPTSLTLSQNSLRLGSRPSMTATDRFLILACASESGGTYEENVGAGLFTVDRQGKITHHGRPCPTLYHLPDFNVIWPIEYRAAFRFGNRWGAQPQINALTDLRKETGTLIPRTRLPSFDALDGDRDWLWITSGQRVYLYSPENQQWFGSIQLVDKPGRIRVGKKYVWLSGWNDLYVIDRSAVLRMAPSEGLPNSLVKADLEAALNRLPPGERGLGYLRLGQFERAAECLAEAVQNDITEPSYFMALFLVCTPWGLDRSKEMERYGNRIRELYPESSWSETVSKWTRYALTNPPQTAKP